MKLVLLTIVLASLVGSVTFGQDDPEDYAAYSPEAIPVVKFNTHAENLQAGMYPEFYKSHSAARDLRWVRHNDSAVVTFCEEKGDSVLLVLSELSGLEWVESELIVYLVRYYPSAGGSDPLIIPLGGMRRGVLNEAAPAGGKMQFNLILQLAHRMLAQAQQSDDPFARALDNHPLMQAGAYRRDNLAMLLALVTSQRIIGLDSTFAAYQSAFWKQRTPGREIMEQYMLSEWILSSEHPLALWVVDEPLSSKFVTSTRPPRRSRQDTSPVKRIYLEGLPYKGELGFSVTTGNANRLVVDKIDVLRLAYACGLREGDVFREVDGRRVRTHKDLIEKILARLDEGGTTVTIMRDDQTETILIQPLDLTFDDELYFWEESEESLFQEFQSTSDTTKAPEE